MNLTPIPFLFAMLIGVCGCKKHNISDEDQACKIKIKIGRDDHIVGSWQLVKEQTVFFEPKTIDHSCNDIIYDFRADGTLIVNGDPDSPTQRSYELLPKPLEASNEEFTLKIDALVMGCEVSPEEMVLNRSYLDGPIKHFVRIK